MVTLYPYGTGVKAVKGTMIGITGIYAFKTEATAAARKLRRQSAKNKLDQRGAWIPDGYSVQVSGRNKDSVWIVHISPKRGK